MSGAERVIASAVSGAVAALAAVSLYRYGVVDSVVGFLQIGAVMSGVTAVLRLAIDEDGERTR